MAGVLSGSDVERSARASSAGSWVVGSVAGALGENAQRKGQRTRVVVNPWLACAACDRCRAGLSGQCLRGRLLGTAEAPGGLSGTIEVPVSAVHVVPGGLDDEVAVFAPLVGDVAHMLQQVAIRDRNFVTILGDTPMALIAGQVLAQHNKAVRVLGDHAEALSVGDRWGLKARLAGEVGLRSDQDVVVLCDRSPAMLERALGMIRPRGELVLKAAWPGAFMDPSAQGAWGPELIDAITRLELRVSGSWVGSPRIGLAMLERGEVDVLPLIARRIDAATAIGLLSEAAVDGQHPPTGWALLDQMVVRMGKAA